MQITYESEVCGLCRDLVRCQSLSGQEKSVADLVQREMEMLGYDHIERDPLGNVVGVIRGAVPGRVVLFDAHMDVVPVTSAEAWRHPPFSGLQAEGRIWGRGATDIKGSLAAALVAIGSLPRKSLAGSTIMCASVGEEMSEGLALGHVLAHHPADMVVICEPTGLQLGLGHKGRAGLVVTATGVSAHSSRPELGVNAIYRLIEAISRIRQIAPRQDDLLGCGVNELVEIISRPYPGTSMVPDGCRARFDRRLVRGETRKSVLDEMRRALAGLGAIEVHYHRAELSCYTGQSLVADDFHPAWTVSPDSEIVRRARRGLTQTGQRPEIYLAPYCSNGAASAGEMGLPTIIYGAGKIEDAHSVSESLSVESLLAAFRGYQGLALALAEP